MKITLKSRVTHIKISMSTTEEELWETAVKLNPGFMRIEKTDSGSLVAYDHEGQQLSTHVPTLTKRDMPVNEDNMKDKEVIIGTPDGETAIIEQNPTNSDIRVDQSGQHPGIMDAPQHSQPSYASHGRSSKNLESPGCPIRELD